MQEHIYLNISTERGTKNALIKLRKKLKNILKSFKVLIFSYVTFFNRIFLILLKAATTTTTTAPQQPPPQVGQPQQPPFSQQQQQPPQLVNNIQQPPLPPNPAENKIPGPDFLQNQMTAARAGTLVF